MFVQIRDRNHVPSDTYTECKKIIFSASNNNICTYYYNIIFAFTSLPTAVTSISSLVTGSNGTNNNCVEFVKKSLPILLFLTIMFGMSE